MFRLVQLQALILSVSILYYLKQIISQKWLPPVSMMVGEEKLAMSSIILLQSKVLSSPS
jgi:hypothetical protein